MNPQPLFEGVDPEVSKRVIRLIVFGGMPSAVDAELHQRLIQESVDLLKDRPVRVLFEQE